MPKGWLVWPQPPTMLIPREPFFFVTVTRCGTQQQKMMNIIIIIIIIIITKKSATDNDLNSKTLIPRWSDHSGTLRSGYMTSLKS